MFEAGGEVESILSVVVVIASVVAFIVKTVKSKMEHSAEKNIFTQKPGDAAPADEKLSGTEAQPVLKRYLDAQQGRKPVAAAGSEGTQNIPEGTGIKPAAMNRSISVSAQMHTAGHLAASTPERPLEVLRRNEPACDACGSKYVNAQHMREAVVMAEILNKPVSLRKK